MVVLHTLDWVLKLVRDEVIRRAVVAHLVDLEGSHHVGEVLVGLAVVVEDGVLHREHASQLAGGCHDDQVDRPHEHAFEAVVHEGRDVEAQVQPQVAPEGRDWDARVQGIDDDGVLQGAAVEDQAPFRLKVLSF